MKVWVVLNQWDYENVNVENVFDNEEAAKRIVEENNAKAKNWKGWSYVEKEVQS